MEDGSSKRYTRSGRMEYTHTGGLPSLQLLFHLGPKPIGQGSSHSGQILQLHCAAHMPIISVNTLTDMSRACFSSYPGTSPSN